MPDNEFQDQTQRAAQSILQNKPQRQSGWRRNRILSAILLLVGGAIIVGTGIVVAELSFSSGPVPAKNANPPAVNDKQSSSDCGQSLPPSYWDTLLQQAASGLHLSVTWVKAQIRARKRIQDIAAAQGISQQQLHTIEVNALQAANNQMVRMKCQTQSQANANVQSYVERGPQDMNDRFTYWFTQ